MTVGSLVKLLEGLRPWDSTAEVVLKCTTDQGTFLVPITGADAVEQDVKCGTCGHTKTVTQIQLKGEHLIRVTCEGGYL